MQSARDWGWKVTFVAVAALAGGCASTAGVRPTAFPRAPAPSVATRVPAPVVVSRIPNPVDLVRSAMQFRGVHYRLGGELPSVGFDCSGFVRYVFSLHQIALPRTVSEQYELGAKVKTDDVREGDLVFFSTVAHGASHVGLAISHTEFIHAPGSSGVVRIDRLASPYWHERIVAVKRLS